MKYQVKKHCDWQSFVAHIGQELDDADLTTADGRPLPPEVVKHFVRLKALVPVTVDVPADLTAALADKG